MIGTKRDKQFRSCRIHKKVIKIKVRAVKRIKVEICSLLICDKRAKNNELRGDEGQAECELTLICPEMKSPR